jgi:universal stress protein E
VTSIDNELHPRSVRYAERAVCHDAIQKILVVVDPTATLHPCVEKAARLAASFGSTLELFVCDVDQGVPESWAGGTTLAQYRGLMRERRWAMLESLAAPLRERGIHVRTDSEWHVPLEEGILRHAIHTKADLVVKDTHRHAPASHMPDVQTDWLLIRQLPMPLLLVRPTPWAAHPKIAVSVDPCKVAERPIELDDSLVSLGCSIGRALTGEVELLHALQPLPHLPGEKPTAEAIRAAHEAQHKAVAHVAERASIGQAGVKFLERRIPEGIVDLVGEERPAVLIMGVAARQRFQQGAASTASQVLERTACDLLIVKPTGFISPALVTDG